MERKLRDLTLEVTQQCPNSCLFCSSLSSMNSRHQLSFDEIMYVSNQAVPLGLQTIGISGGEPLLHPAIKRVIPQLNRNHSVRLYTTGICFGRDGKATHFTDWNAFDSSRTAVIFNVQSTDPRIHDHLTCRSGSLALTTQAIHSAKSNGFQVEAHLVPNLINLDTIQSSVVELTSWGVDQISFLRLVAPGQS